MFCDRTTLPRSGLETSRLGLGCAHLHTLSPAERARLIDEAIALGVIHFDTARFYGDGLSETTLGRKLGARRDEIILATKFGLMPTPLIGSAGPFGFPLRKTRSLLRKLRLIQYPKHSYTVRTLQAHLQASLRALRTDRIDLYFLHEPRSDSVPEDGVFEILRQEKQKGTLRYVGLAGSNIGPILSRFRSEIDVVQCGESSWPDGNATVPDITYSLFSGSRKDDPGIRQRLELALARRPRGTVLVQTRSPLHLRQLVEWAAGK